MLGIGFIGVGGMGRHQAQSFAKAEGCRIVAGSDPSGDSRAKFGGAHPQVKLYEDHRKLLKDATVDAVVVAVPTGHHAAMAIDALRAGRHVLTEKPMARTVAECYRMMDAAKKARRRLMVAHCRRFDTDWGAFADVYRTGRLGKQVLWRHLVSAKPGFAPWFLDERLGAGPLMDGAVHDQDFANMLFGAPESVVGDSLKLDRAVSAIDTASVVIRYKSGSQLLLSWSWVTRGQNVNDVLGAKSTFIFGANGKPVPDGMGAHTLIANADGKEELVTFKPADMYVTQAQHFVDLCTGKAKKCLAPPEEAVKAVAVSTAALHAARTGKVAKVKW